MSNLVLACRLSTLFEGLYLKPYAIGFFVAAGFLKALNLRQLSYCHQRVELKRAIAEMLDSSYTGGQGTVSRRDLTQAIGNLTSKQKALVTSVCSVYLVFS
jgi:hypothetical protein